MRSHERSSWMWAEAFDLLNQADRLHRQFFRPAQVRAPGPSWEPPFDMMETDQHLYIIVALPGVSVDGLRVTVEGASLRVVGERSIPAPGNAVIRRLEIPYGHFERRIELPAQRYELEQRVLEDGCLRLVLRKLSPTLGGA